MLLPVTWIVWLLPSSSTLLSAVATLAPIQFPEHFKFLPGYFGLSDSCLSPQLPVLAVKVKFRVRFSSGPIFKAGFLFSALHILFPLSYDYYLYTLVCLSSLLVCQVSVAGNSYCCP